MGFPLLIVIFQGLLVCLIHMQINQPGLFASSEWEKTWKNVRSHDLQNEVLPPPPMSRALIWGPHLKYTCIHTHIYIYLMYVCLIYWHRPFASRTGFHDKFAHLRRISFPQGRPGRATMMIQCSEWIVSSNSWFFAVPWPLGDGLIDRKTLEFLFEKSPSH